MFQGPRRRAETGFVLIGAVWLLLLAAIIVAVLIARGLSSARTVQGLEARLREKLLLDAATETIAAELLFDGPRSPWWLMPAAGSLTLEGGTVEVRVVNEAGKLDLNTADLKLIDQALGGFGMDAGARHMLVDRLDAMRRAKRVIASESELQTILYGLDTSADRLCLSENLTVYTSAAMPRESQMGEALRKASGTVSTLVQAGPLPSDAITVQVSQRGKGEGYTTLRITGSVAQPLGRLAYNRFICPRHV